MHRALALRSAAAAVLAGAALAFALDPRARDAADQADGPFLLVAGLLLLGLVADADGVFAWASDRLLAVTTRPRRLLAVALGLVALVTAVLNLDTAVVFLTPILVRAARGADVDEEVFLYGAVLMANASSLLLPGANLTNLIVLADEPVSGAAFTVRILPAALAAAAVTAAGLLLRAPRGARSPGDRPGPPPSPRTRGGSRVRVRRLGAGACALAAALVLALPHPGVPVLAVGLAAAAVRVREGRLDVAVAVRAVGPFVLGTLFALSVLLGLLARAWSGPTDLLAAAAPWETTGIGALIAAAVNNLPAAVLLSATPPPHPRALLLGLDLGPNLVVTGSLSSYLWFKAARGVGARPSAVRYTVLGAPLAVAAMAGGLAAIALIGPT